MYLFDYVIEVRLNAFKFKLITRVFAVINRQTPFVKLRQAGKFPEQKFVKKNMRTFCLYLRNRDGMRDSKNFLFPVLFCLPHKKVPKKVTVDDKFAVL